MRHKFLLLCDLESVNLFSTLHLTICGQPRKAPRAYEPPPHYHEQQVGDQRYPNLYLDGIGTLSIEVFEWKILLYLLEQQLYGPSFVVDIHDFERVRGHVVSQEGDEFALLNIDISDDACVMNNSGTALEFLSEGNSLYTNLHHPFRRLTHDVLLYRVLQVLLHLRDIDDAALRHLLKLSIVDIGTIQGNDIPPVQRGRQEHKRVVGGCGSEADVRWNSLVGLDYTVYFDTPFFLPVLGCLPTPLKSRLEKRVIVVESIIFSRFIHFGSFFLVHSRLSEERR